MEVDFIDKHADFGHAKLSFLAMRSGTFIAAIVVSDHVVCSTTKGYYVV